MSTGITQAKTLGELKRMVGPARAGYRHFHRPLGQHDTTLDLYLVPDTAPASAPNDIPEGSTLVGIVVYESRAAALADLS